MTKCKKLLSLLLSMAILLSSVFVGGMFASATVDLYTTTMTFDDDFADNEVEFGGYTNGPGDYSCATVSIDGTVPVTNNGDKDHYIGCWGVTTADVSAIGGEGKALLWDTGFNHAYEWLPRSTVYTHNVVSGNLERFKPKANTTYEIRLKYYAAKDPQRDMVMTVRWSTYDEVHFGFAYNDSHLWCDNVFTVTDATDGWVEAVAKFTTPASPGYMNLVMSYVNGDTATSSSKIEIYTDDITVSECAPITAHNFDDNGNKVLYASQYNTVADLEVPTREGYIFSGIYSDASLTNKVSNSELAVNYTDLYYAWNELEDGEYYCGFEGYTADTNGTSYDSTVSHITSEDVYAGGYAMQNVLTNGELVSFELRDKTYFNVVKGTEYNISFAYKASADAKIYAGLAAASHVPSSAYAITAADLSATNTWKTASIDVTLDKGTTDGFALALMLSAADAVVVIDDVFVTYPVDKSTVNMPSIEDPGTSWYPTLGVFEGITFGEASSIWDGKTYTAPVDSDEDGVYEITNGEELAYVVKKVGGEGKDYIITKDIYLNDVSKVNWLTGEVAEGHTINSWFQTWTADGSYIDFSGNINGNFHTVYGLYFDINKDNVTLDNNACALIPRLAADSDVTIKNLAIDKTYIKHEASAAAFVGSQHAAAKLTITNCYAGKDVLLKACSTGVFRAYAKSAGTFNLTNCYSLATTESSYKTGTDSTGNYNGLVGEMWEGSNTCVISSCYNANGCISNFEDSEFYSNVFNCYQTAEGGNYSSGVTTISADNMVGKDALASADKMIALNAFGNYFVATDSYPTLSVFKGIAVSEIWDGTTSEPLEKDEDENVLIHNGKELAWIISNGGVAGTTYKLTNNIYLNRLDIIDWSTGETPDGYTPTAWYEDKSFVGNLDGDGYTVYGLYHNDGVSTSEMSQAFSGTVGLIPHIPDGAVVNLSKIGVDYMFINAKCTASPLVGSVGSNSGSTSSGTTLNIDQCYIGENVDVTAFGAGHVRGYARYCALNVSNTYSLGTVRSNMESTAFDPELTFFIANGWDGKFVSLYNCYVLHGGYYKGGWPSIATRVNSYAGGLTPGLTTVWYVCNSDTSLDESTMSGLDALTASNKMPKLNVDADGNPTTMYTATEGYPILTVFNGKMDSTIKAPEVEEDDNSGSSDNTGSGSNDNVKYTIWDGSTSIAPTVGTGTEADPFIINEAAELHYVIKNGGAADTYYKINKDIYLNDLTKVNWLTGTIAEGYKVNEWISGIDAVFQGHIDGNAHTIYGLYVQDDKLSYSTYHSYGAGFISHAKEGTITIKNLAIDNSFMRYEAGCGLFVGAVGETADVSLTNCYAGANVGLDGGSVSGLIGVVLNGTVDVLNCYSLATVIHSEIDGIVASDYNGGATITINNCFNADGPVADYNYAGTVVNNCFQTEVGYRTSGVTTVSKENMKGDDVLTNPEKMAGLSMANAYITKNATFAQQDIYTYLPAGTKIDSSIKATFYDNMMAPLADNTVLLRGKMLRGAYVKFEELPDETLIKIPLAKADKANIRGGAIEILVNTEYYGVESEIVSKHLDAQSNASVNYLFVTDIHNTHTTASALKSPRGNANMKQMELLAKLANENDEIDFIALGGDLTQGYSADKQNHLTFLKDLLTPILESKKPVLALTGNHDDNSYTDVGSKTSVISELDWNNTVIKYLEDGIGFKVVHDKDNANSKYYYYDIADKKTRVICLNASDYPQEYDANGNITWLADNNTTVDETSRSRYKTGYNFWGYSDAQVEWVANDALNAEDGWNYIVLSHMAIDKSSDGTESYKNGDVLRNIFKDFQSKNYYLNEGLGIDRDWTETNGKILSYQFGHEHKYSVKYNEDIDLWQFATTSSGGSNSSLSQIFWSENQLNFDLMSVNENYIYKHAIGGGVDGKYISSYYQLEGDINVDGEVDITDAVKFALVKEGKSLPTARTKNQNETKIRRIILGDIIALPDYYQDEASEDAEKINALLASSSENTASFLHWTDVHWRTNHESSYKLLKYFTQTTSIDKVNFTGDVGNDDDPTPDGINEWRKVSLMLPNHHSVTGNHEYTTPHLYEYAIESDGPKDGWDTDADIDKDGVVDTFIDGQRTKQNIYDYLLAPEFAQNPDVIKGNKDGELCYYIDNEAEKTRYMYLKNSRGFGAGPSLYEYQWMVETLESTPAGWHIVAFSHEWFQSTTSHPDPANVYETPENSRGVQELFDDYNARKIGYTNYYSVPFDFTGNTATVELMVAGDNHRDNVSFTKGGIPMVILMTDGQGRSKNNKPDVQANDGTADENAVSTFIVDYDNRVVNIIRTGANGDIVVPLTAVGATYVEPTSCTDLATSETVKADYKLNTSGTEVAAEGYGTVYIDLPDSGKTWKYRDDIYLRLDGVPAALNEYQLIFYKNDENGVPVYQTHVELTWGGGVCKPNNSVTTYPIVYDTDENGNIVYIDLTAFTCIRAGATEKPYDSIGISAKGLTADSIITYSEPLVK